MVVAQKIIFLLKKLKKKKMKGVEIKIQTILDIAKQMNR